MKIHLAWKQLTTTAVIVAFTTAPAAAQYPPYRPIPVMPTATPPAAAPQPAGSTPLQTGYGPQVPYVAYREGSVQAPAQARAMAPATTAAAAPATPLYQGTPYTATQPAAQPYRVAQLPPPASQSYQPAGQYQAAAPYQTMIPAYPQTAAPAERYGQNMYVAQQPAPIPPQGDTNGAATTNGGTGNNSTYAAPMNGAVRNGSAAPATMSEAYANGVYSANGYGSSNGSSPAYGCGSYDTGCCDGGHQNIWFGGVYFLYMERDNSERVALSAAMPDGVVTAGLPYYPSADTYVLSASDYDFQPGVEVRFGSTFTIGDSCDTCSTGCGNYGYGYGGCNTCAPCYSGDIYAWEVGCWGLFEDENNSTYIVDQTGGNGMYGMVDFRGLEYDRDGAAGVYAYAPVNNYYGSDMPLAGPSTEVLAQCVRTNFQAQNLELNIFRIPFCGPACGGSSCGGDSCGCDNSRMCSAYGACGVRYFRIDDDFFYGTEFNGGTQPAYDGWSFADDNELFYEVEVDNQLIGPQLGWTMNYSVGCKWNFFMNSTFGVFENHISSRQRMWSGGGGPVRFVNDDSAFDVDNSKDDISFLGELRLGGLYDVTCHWRAVLAYRGVAATGLATSVGQIPTNFYNSSAVSYIDSNESMIVHGVQIGAECRY